jgi:endonuclease G
MNRRQRLFVNLFLVLIRHPKILLIALLLGGLSYSYEYFYARDTMSYMGIPRARDDAKEHWTRIFRNEAYMVGYSDLRGNPLWVVYKLTPIPLDATPMKRPERFERDWRTLWSVSQEDYTGSGFDRGHMAPNRALSLVYGKAAQQESFLMSNITPQRPSLNQKIWERLETMELERFVAHFQTVWVYTGPLFAQHPKTLKSTWRVEIPEAFYKVYIGLDVDKKPHALAVIIPQNAKVNDMIEKYAVSIDEVERRSGFDFFHALEDSIERPLESKIDLQGWF